MKSAMLATLFALCFSTCLWAQDSSTQSKPAKLDRYEYERPAMGTTLQITVYSPNDRQAKLAIEHALEVMEQLSLVISNYDPKSEVMRLNSSFGRKFDVSSDLSSIMLQAKRWHEISQGRFDVTAGPVIRVWKNARKSKVLPSDHDLANTLNASGWDKFNFRYGKNPNDHRIESIELREAQCWIDLSGLATGFIIDRMFESFANDGLEKVLINIGGDIRLGSAPPNSGGWNVEIAGLGKSSPRLMRRKLARCAITTSGDLTQFVIIDGRRYSHLIDPTNCKPLHRRQSATVIAETNLDADAGATAVSILGMEMTAAMFEELPILEAIMLEADDEGMSDDPDFIRYRHFTATP